MNDYNSQTLNHPLPGIKDEWVVSRKSIHAGGLTIDRHIKSPDEIELGATEHHAICYHLDSFNPRQITRIDGKKYEGVMRKGDFWLKPAPIPGFWRWESTDECLLFAIDPAFLSQIAMENDCANSDEIEILPVLKTRDPILDALVIQFEREMENPEFGNLMYIESLANQFAIHLLRQYCTFSNVNKEYTGGLPPYKLKQAIEYINDNLDKQIKLKDIARLVDISQYYFCRLFRESTGLSPYKYVIQQRVAKAKNAIENSKLSLTDIAYECGFSSQSQMTQHFRLAVGITPKVYRVTKSCR